jgi:hypothetical protein
VHPTWLLWASAASYHHGIRRPTLGRTELPAALGSLFAPGALSRGPVIEQMPGRRAAVDWLRWAVRAGELFTFPVGLRKFAVLAPDSALMLESLVARSTDL